MDGRHLLTAAHLSIHDSRVYSLGPGIRLTTVYHTDRGLVWNTTPSTKTDGTSQHGDEDLKVGNETARQDADEEMELEEPNLEDLQALLAMGLPASFGKAQKRLKKQRRPLGNDAIGELVSHAPSPSCTSTAHAESSVPCSMDTPDQAQGPLEGPDHWDDATSQHAQQSSHAPDQWEGAMSQHAQQASYPPAMSQQAQQASQDSRHGDRTSSQQAQRAEASARHSQGATSAAACPARSASGRDLSGNDVPMHMDVGSQDQNRPGPKEEAGRGLPSMYEGGGGAGQPTQAEPHGSPPCVEGHRELGDGNLAKSKASIAGKGSDELDINKPGLPANAVPRAEAGGRWQEAYDSQADSYYYYRESTQETQWEAPAGGFIPAPYSWTREAYRRSTGWLGQFPEASGVHTYFGSPAPHIDRDEPPSSGTHASFDSPPQHTLEDEPRSSAPHTSYESPAPHPKGSYESPAAHPKGDEPRSHGRHTYIDSPAPHTEQDEPRSCAVHTYIDSPTSHTEGGAPRSSGTHTYFASPAPHTVLQPPGTHSSYEPSARQAWVGGEPRSVGMHTYFTFPARDGVAGDPHPNLGYLGPPTSLVTSEREGFAAVPTHDDPPTCDSLVADVAAELAACGDLVADVAAELAGEMGPGQAMQAADVAAELVACDGLVADVASELAWDMGQGQAIQAPEAVVASIAAETAEGEQMSRRSQQRMLEGFVSPVPPHLIKYWLQRYSLWWRYDEGVTMDEQGWYSATPEAIARHHAEVCGAQQGILVDAFTGTGGNAVHFAVEHQVIAIDINPNRLAHAQDNAGVYGVQQRIDFVCADFFVVASRLKADTVFLSPPWGGPQYSAEGALFSLSNLGGSGMTLGFMLRSALQALANPSTGRLIIFLPRNTPLKQLSEQLPGGWCCNVERNVLNRRLKAITLYCYKKRRRGKVKDARNKNGDNLPAT